MNFFDRSLVFTDVETTGLKAGYHEIIEIGAVLVHPKTLKTIRSFEVKIRPEHIERASAKALEVNGYRPEDWTGALLLNEAMERYTSFANGAVLWTWNVTFDWKFLEHAFETTGVPNRLDYHFMDVASLAWLFLRPRAPEKFSLEVACTLLGIEPEPTVHRGINGARKALEAFKALSFSLG